MTNLHNIDRSAFRKGEYIGWRASDGQLFHIRKGLGGWRATNRNATGVAGDTLTGDTLTALSHRLAQS